MCAGPLCDVQFFVQFIVFRPFPFVSIVPRTFLALVTCWHLVLVLHLILMKIFFSSYCITILQTPDFAAKCWTFCKHSQCSFAIKTALKLTVFFYSSFAWLNETQRWMADVAFHVSGNDVGLCRIILACCECNANGKYPAERDKMLHIAPSNASAACLCQSQTF